MELYECIVWRSFQWHLGFFTEDYTPNRRGFDSFYGYYSGMEDYFDHTYAAGWPDRVSMLSSCITVLCCALFAESRLLSVFKGTDHACSRDMIGALSIKSRSHDPDHANLG